MATTRTPSARRDEEATRQAIIAAAAKIVAKDGYEGLNMRLLAERSGLATMTLYRYVENKDRLLSMLAEATFEEIELPEKEHEDWEQEVLNVFRAAHELLLEHPELVEIIAKQHMNGQPSFRAGERALRAMRRGGMSPELAAEAFVAMTAYLVGVTQRQQYKGGTNLAQAWSAIEDLPEDEFENIVATAHRLIPRPPDSILEDGFRYLLRGFAGSDESGAARRS
jgi:AcrR family transcriptional regulator